jgi:hypothetical protein
MVNAELFLKNTADVKINGMAKKNVDVENSDIAAIIPKFIAIASLYLWKRIGSTMLNASQTTKKTTRAGTSPINAIKLSSDKWYIKPNPISAPPIGMPILGLLNATKATRTANNIGKGCGKSGKNDRANIMLAKVKIKVIILIGVDSRAFSFLSFSFPLCLRALRFAINPVFCGFFSWLGSTSTCCSSCFSFFPCFRELNNERKRDFFGLFSDFKGEYLKPYFTKPFLSLSREHA